MRVVFKASTVRFMISIIIVASLTAAIFIPIALNHKEYITIKVELPKNDLETILKNVSWTRLELQYHVAVKQYMYYHAPQTVSLGFYTFSPRDPLTDYITIRIPYRTITEEEFQWIFSNKYKIVFIVSLGMKVINDTGVIFDDRTSWSKVYDPKEFLGLFGQEVVISKTILANTLFKELKLSLEKPPIELVIHVYEKSGEPLKEGTAYVWIGRPRNASLFVGGFEIENGTVRVDIREYIEPVLEEWKEYITEVKEPNQTFLWITIAYPGDIYDGMTILFDPIKVLEEGGRLVKTIVLPVNVDYSKPIPELVSG